ncbi:hypothetical protein HAX54_036700 [Datura stramonium]|uniref:Uncharacterized protein n=1 Tax=Datura stramonium TaxID=4076 RepID=A0ABS8VKK3_DATST|nr:hypothetical protein [Datura stramonium]
MTKKRASSSASQSKAPIGRGAGHGTTPGGSRAGPHQTRAQTRAQANLQHEIVNGDVVMRLLNVLEALVPNHGRLPVRQTNSKAQTQAQLNVAATQTP